MDTNEHEFVQKENDHGWRGFETRSAPASLVATLATLPSISLIPQLDCTDITDVREQNWQESKRALRASGRVGGRRPRIAQMALAVVKWLNRQIVKSEDDGELTQMEHEAL